MNYDDPKLTAYALDSLPENERAQIEALLKEQPSAATEVDETREMAGVMRQLFQGELTETLQPRRREAILQAAIDARSMVPVVPLTNVIEPHVSWWRRAVVWQAAAACAIFGFGVYAISVTLSKPSDQGNRTAATGGNSGHLVSIDGLRNDSTGGAPEAVAVGVPDEVGPGKTPGSIASTPPGTQKVPLSPKGTDLGPLLTDNKVIPGKPTQPTVIGPVNPGRERADIAPAARRPGTQNIADNVRPTGPGFAVTNPGERMVLPTDSGDLTLTAEESGRYFAMREYLNTRWQEASSIREGSTYQDLARYFRRDGGSTPPDTFRFVMIKCPFIKVDVEFTSEDGKAITWPVSPDTRIRAVSRPLFEPEQGK